MWIIWKAIDMDHMRSEPRARIIMRLCMANAYATVIHSLQNPKLKHCYYVSKALNRFYFVFFVLFCICKMWMFKYNHFIVCYHHHHHFMRSCSFLSDFISNFFFFYFCHALRFLFVVGRFYHSFIHLYKLAITFSFNVTSW